MSVELEADTDALGADHMVDATFAELVLLSPVHRRNKAENRRRRSRSDRAVACHAAGAQPKRELFPVSLEQSGRADSGAREVLTTGLVSGKRRTTPGLTEEERPNEAEDERLPLSAARAQAAMLSSAAATAGSTYTSTTKQEQPEDGDGRSNAIFAAVVATMMDEPATKEARSVSAQESWRRDFTNQEGHVEWYQAALKFHRVHRVPHVGVGRTEIGRSAAARAQ